MMDFHVLASHVAVMFAGSAGSEIVKGAGEACGSSCGPSSIVTLFKNIANVLTFLIGSVSVLMILYGGFRYVISRGDQANVKAAKDTILYAVMGVVVAVIAYAVVQFVVASIGGAAAPAPSPK